MSKPRSKNKYFRHIRLISVSIVGLLIVAGIVYAKSSFSVSVNNLNSNNIKDATSSVVKKIVAPQLDKKLYDEKMLALANYPAPKISTSTVATSTATSTQATTTVKILPWPVKGPYPNYGAILPFKRVIAYYGNLYSKQMGALGEYPEAEMFSRLDAEVKKWELADPSTPVQPALHYIAVTAQASAGKDGKYRLQMPDKEIDKVLVMAEKINAIVFLDIQIGLSTLEEEIPELEKYLKMPQVHLGIDPEFSMKTKQKPGTVIGSFDAKDINYATEYLAKLVRDNNLPPKILVIHRFTQPMITNADKISLVPEVQIVMHMDGWGSPERKIDSYQAYVQKEPVQFTGFKLFYKNDTIRSKSRLMTPEELLKLQPRPIYIQYQ